MDNFKDENFSSVVLTFIFLLAIIVIAPFTPNIFDIDDGMLKITYLIGVLILPIAAGLIAVGFSKLFNSSYKKLTFIIVFLIFAILSILGQRGYGINYENVFGPKNYDDCILEGLRGVNNEHAAILIARACRSKFPEVK